MASVTECLSQIQNLTKKNLEILQAINESYFTKQSHLQVNVGDAKYVIPSFMSVENRLSVMEENFNNLINAPSTNEAYFHIDGNTRAIEVKPYTQVPNALVLNEVKEFSHYQNDVFKDFLTPIPYVNFNLSSLPNDITSVVVKKIIPKNQTLIDNIKSLLQKQEGNNIIYSSSLSYKYADIYKMLAIYKEDEDYVEYDTIKKLPIRQNIGNGVYVIESIKDDVIDTNLDNFITIKLRNDLDSKVYMNTLSYRLFNETIEKKLSIGDQLVTFDGTGKMEIVEMFPNINTIKVRVMNGDFLNLVGTSQYNSDKGINDLSKIKFFSPIDFDNDKYIQVPLEEDQFIFIAVAALNDRMNIQSPWGNGVLMNTFELKDEKGVDFSSYYDNNVKNIGDILFEITSMMDNTLTKFNDIEFDKMSKAKPIINLNDIQVVRINNHLNNSTTLKNIKALYSQKKKYNSELTEIQQKIDDINKQLTRTSFEDTTNIRPGYLSQLSEYNVRKSEIVTAITKVIDEISKVSNDAEVPIENAKYRIRGFFDIDEFIKHSELSYTKQHINGIKVQYRYKTIDQERGSAMTMNKGFIFSDWNEMPINIVKKTPYYDNGYKFSLNNDNGKLNEPSFNQIDIPISQGETVDVRLKVLYDYGYPFIEMTSDWSEVVNIEFPDEFLKDIQILDIITENNNDIETNRFNTILLNAGVTSHVDDKITDQDLTYFHKPDNISSGFYTNERRIIPLKDKLEEMNNIIMSLKKEIEGSQNEDISVSIINDNNITELIPWNINNISVEPYTNFVTNINKTIGGYTVNNDGLVSTLLNIVIKNNSSMPISLYSIFPGPNNYINYLNSYKFDIHDYCFNNSIGGGVWLRSQYQKSADLQKANQFITFRVRDLSSGATYYNSHDDIINLPEDQEYSFDFMGSQLSSTYDYISMEKFSDSYGAAMYPFIKEPSALIVESSTNISSLQLAPGQEIIIPIMYEYRLENGSSVTKTMSFDLRTSLYKEPTNYIFSVTSKYNHNTLDTLARINRKIKDKIIYKSIIK